MEPSNRSPELTVVSQGIARVWFLLHWGQFHLSLTTQASACLSTGVSALRRTTGEPGATARNGSSWSGTRLGFRPVRIPASRERIPGNVTQYKDSDFQLLSSQLLPSKVHDLLRRQVQVQA